MLENILEIIRKNLPEQTAGLLKEHLEECERVKKKNVELQKTVDLKSDEILSLKQEIARLQVLEVREKEIFKKESQLKEKEYLLSRKQDSLEIELLKIKLEMTQQSRNEISNLASIVFKNPKIVLNESLNHNKNVNGIYENTYSNITKTIEEVKD